MKGIMKISSGRGASPLAEEAAAAMARHRRPAELILASGDATAIAAESELKSISFKGLSKDFQRIDSDSHTFARPGDEAALLDSVLEAVRRLEAQAS